MKRVLLPTLLYLKAQTPTEASNRLTRRVVAGQIASVIDDPSEGANQPLSWYVNRVDSASAVVCHLLSSDYVNWQISNAKQAFVAGMAHGLGKPMLMLAHEPYTSPLDYRDLLRTHDTAAKAEILFDEWSAPLVDAIRRQEANADHYQDHQYQKIAQTTLDRIDLGSGLQRMNPKRFRSTSSSRRRMRKHYARSIQFSSAGRVLGRARLSASSRMTWRQTTEITCVSSSL